MTSGNAVIVDLAYDVLGLEALFLVPRIFSLLSLNPYFGTLVSQVCSDIPSSFPYQTQQDTLPLPSASAFNTAMPGRSKIAARHLRSPLRLRL